MEEPKVYEIKLTVKEKTSDVKVEKKSKGVMGVELDEGIDEVVNKIKELL